MMGAFAITLVCAFAICVALAGAQSLEWSLFKRQYGKSYAGAGEEARRFANFMATKTHVERHNANASKSFKLGLSHLADWSADELTRLNGFKIDAGALRREIEASPRATDRRLQSILRQFNAANSDVPAAIDWRQVPGRVSGVKDQRLCGSCWTFATTGLLEGQQVARNFTQELVPLSEQNLLDCAGNGHGCIGGQVSAALAAVKSMGGIESEAAYPYAARDQTCQFARSKSVMAAAGAVALPSASEAELKKVVASYGPVAAAMFASRRFFLHYAQGVLDDPDCAGMEELSNHAVLIIGYGTDPKWGDFWLVKNSWNVSWGERGYFRIRRGSNMCGIGQTPIIALF